MARKKRSRVSTRKSRRREPAKRPKPAKPALISGVRGLGRALGCTGKRACEYINDPRWPFHRKRWNAADVEKIKAWRDENFDRPAEQSGDVPAGNAVEPPQRPDDPVAVAERAELRRLSIEQKKANLKKKVEDGIEAEFLNRQRMGGLLKAEDVEKERLERVEAVKYELMTLPRLSLKLHGIDIRAMEQVLEQWARDVCRKFSAGPETA